MFIFLKPGLIWKLTEEWKSYRADELSDLYFIFIILFINILIMKGDLPMGAPMKNSRQRNAILECVMRHHDHPTADIIYQELRESFPNISLGTVYRNLSLLTSLGKIMKITCENHADRFDGQTKPHAHFECKSCGCLARKWT